MRQPENSAPIKTQTADSNKTTILIISCLASISATFMMSALNGALPVMNQDFQADAILLGWTITSYILAVAVFSVPFGRLADIVGIKKIFIIGTAIYTIATVLSFFASSAIMLIAYRAIQALGSAMIFSTSTAMLTAAYPAKERGRALGLSVASVYLGLSLGPILGGLLTEHFGWRSIFLTNIPFGIIILFLVVWKVKGEFAESRGEKFDYAGSIIFGLALTALMYGFSLLPELSGIITTLIGIVGIIAFLGWENRNESPLINVRVFRNNKTFIFSNLAALINYCGTSAISFLLSLYLQYIKGLNPEQAGLVLIGQPIIMTLVSPFAGRLSDKIEPRIVASVGMTLTCLGLFSFSFLTSSTSIMQIIISLIVIGAGFGLFTSPNTNAIMSSVTPKFFAVAASITGTMRTMGQTLSMGITMIILGITIGRVVITPQYYPEFLSSSKIAFAIFAALCFAGIFASLSRGKREIEEPKASPIENNKS